MPTFQVDRAHSAEIAVSHVLVSEPYRGELQVPQYTLLGEFVGEGLTKGVSRSSRLFTTNRAVTCPRSYKSRILSGNRSYVNTTRREGNIRHTY